MKHYTSFKRSTKKVATGRHPLPVLNRIYDSWYEEGNSSWQEKAQRLQARRWRKIKQQLV